MKELPYPEIDLSSIKGSSSNVFPREFAEKVLPNPENENFNAGEFYVRFRERIERNFEQMKEDRDQRILRTASV